METKYDKIVTFLLDNWIIAIAAIAAIILMSLPKLRDGLKMIFTSSKKNDDLIIEYADEKIVCEIVSRSYDFDIVKIHATTHRLGVPAESTWIKKFYPNYSNNMQILKRIKTDSGEKIFDVIPINNGVIDKKIYFDITDFYDGAHVPITGDVHDYAEYKIKEIYNQNKK